MTEDKKISVKIIHKLMEKVFVQLGVLPEEARICADVLIESDLRGIKSHGIGRLKMYYDRIKAGIQQATTKIDVIKDHKAIAVWDGNHGMGQVIAYRAMKEAIKKAKEFGMGSVAVRNSTHFGIAGYYPLMAAKEKMIGLTVTNARPSVAPTFGIEPMLGTNPIAFSAPSDLEFDFLFDAATSISQRGKVEVYDRMKKDIPAGWVIDEKAEIATDPTLILKKLLEKKASFLPIGGLQEETGGHKGYGLSTIVEILSAALQNGSYMHALSGIENGKRVPYKLGHFFMAINIDNFIEIKEFRKIVGDIMRQLQNSEKAPDKEWIYLAGEKEFNSYEKVKKEGIPINPALLKNIKIMLDELRITDFFASIKE